MLKKVISGGQTGADLGGIRAAQDSGIETGGWIPRNFKTEDGYTPSRMSFGLKETPESTYFPRTSHNARDSDITIWFGDSKSRGGQTTRNACRRHEKPFLVYGKDATPDMFAAILRDFAVVNVAGNREGINPGIEDKTYDTLMQVFKIMDAAGDVYHA